MIREEVVVTQRSSARIIIGLSLMSKIDFFILQDPQADLGCWSAD